MMGTHFNDPHQFAYWMVLRPNSVPGAGEGLGLRRRSRRVWSRSESEQLLFGLFAWIGGECLTFCPECAHVCVCVQIIHLYIYIHTYNHNDRHVYALRVCLWLCMFANVFWFLTVCVCVYVSVCVFCLFVCVCVFLCVRVSQCMSLSVSGCLCLSRKPLTTPTPECWISQNP